MLHRESKKKTTYHRVIQMISYEDVQLGEDIILSVGTGAAGIQNKAKKLNIRTVGVPDCFSTV